MSFPIVSYKDISEAINKNPGKIMAETERGVRSAVQARAGQATGEQMSEAQMLALFTDALRVLEIEEADATPGVLVSSNHELASILQTYIAKNSLEQKKLEEAPSGGIRAKFDEHDLGGWIGSLFSWWKKLDKHPFLEASSEPETLNNNVKVAVLGDWGTGLYGAPVCTSSIERDNSYNLLLHLGDVYYSGDEDEVIDRFLKFWPKNPNTTSRALNSNHEMYTGGRAYFEQTLERFGQPASYFAMQNDHWVLVGLDTAYKEHNLKDEEVNWLRGIVEKAGNKKVVLFSHHQPYSLLERGGEKLVDKLDEFLGAKKIFAWYWGHEHRCTIFDQHPAWGLHGRCVGHSGFPYFRDKLKNATVEVMDQNKNKDTRWHRLNSKNMVPGCLILDGPNPYIPGEEKRYGVQGYMTLEFNGDQLNEIVHLPDGEVVFNRRLV